MQQTKPKIKVVLKTDFFNAKKDVAKVAKNVAGTPVRIYDHITGDKFTHAHKVLCGVVLMVVGVGISKLAAITRLNFIEFLGDSFGYLLHGAGCTPILDFLHYVLLRKTIDKNDSEQVN